MNQPMDPNDLIAEAAMELLREHGPQTAATWGALLADAGHGSADEMAEFVEYVEDPLLGYLSQERYAALDTLFEHRVLTHRLTATEIESGVLDANPDLMMLRVFLDGEDTVHDIRLVHRGDGDQLLSERGIEDPEFPLDEGFVLDADTLTDCSPGDLIGLFVADRELTLCTIAEVLDPTPGFGDTLAGVLGDIGADTLDAIVWQLMLDEPELFRQPTAPLGELLDAAGYVRDGDYVAVDGFDFESFHLTNRVRLLEIRENLHHDEALAVIALVDLVIDAQTDAGSPEGAERVRAQIEREPHAHTGIAEPPAAAAALELISDLDDFEAALHCVATALAEKGPRRCRPAAHWLAGKASDRLGNVMEALASYDAAHDLDPDWTPAIFDLALLAADRSDVTRALSLLGRIEGGESEVLHGVLQRYAPAEHPELGRNDKCWCGSGRKYKMCHLGRSEVTFDDRAQWLYVKAQLFSRTAEFFDTVFDLALIRAEGFQGRGESDGDGIDDALTQAVEGGLAVDTALFDAGIFDAFVERRGELLPADELELARQWQTVSRSVCEVVTVSPENVVTLVDVRTGEHSEVTDEWGSENLTPGTLVCARILPAGSTSRTPGGIELVAAQDKGSLIELLDSASTDPARLVQFLA